MFSPDRTVASLPRRSSRRRQRDESDNAKHEPHRKRSKIADNTFRPPLNAKPTGNSVAVMNGHAKREAKTARSSSWQFHEVPVREKKQGMAGKRVSKGDGSMILTKNAQYAVRRLPSLPEQIRANATEPYQASVLTSSNLALALTHERAMIWDYTSLATSPVLRTLSLPHPSKPSDPLPHGCIVHTAASSDVGLVIVFPTSGKVTFWENVDNAETLSLFHQGRNGVEGSVGNMLSGETILDLVDADHAGFLLLFSTGRLAHLTVRDAQGRPRINVQFLKANSNNGSGGLFSGFKNALIGGGWRKDVATVKARPSGARGQMEAVAMTASGVVQIWNISWAAPPTFKYEVDAQKEIVSVLESDNAPEKQGREAEPNIIDFALFEAAAEGHEVSLPNQTPEIHIFALVAHAGTSSNYFLIEMTVTPQIATIERVIPLTVFTEPSAKEHTWRPRLLIPRPYHTAFVMFDQAIAIMSLLRKDDSPDVQLQTDSQQAYTSFQDALYWRRDRDIQISGYAVEPTRPKTKQSSIAVLLRGFGVVRITANEGAVDAATSVTAKSKIEQAVYFSNNPENILDFSTKPEFTFSQAEVETAATAISREILRSEAEPIPVVMPSMEQQLALRSTALRHLALYVKKNFKPLSRVTRWSLLWEAEKMVAAEGVWKKYDARLNAVGPTRRTLLAELCDMLHERNKNSHDAVAGEHDPVRNLFLKEVGRIDVVVPWAMNAIKDLRDNGGVKEHPAILELAAEANDLMLGPLEAAFQFRQNNLELYGLDDEDQQDGVLRSGYEELPEFWTATHNTIGAIRSLIELELKFLHEYLQGNKDFFPVDQKVLQKVDEESSRMVKLCCITHMERYRWCLAQPNEKKRATGRNMEHQFKTSIRHDLLAKLRRVGKGKEAIALAERFRDMPCLVELAVDEISDLYCQQSEPSLEYKRDEIVSEMNELSARAGNYHNQFGEEYTSAFFDHFIKIGKLYSLIVHPVTEKSRLTNYLRAEPSRARISWLNEVFNEEDFTAAGTTLMKIAKEQETNWWCKKVETSIAKLSFLAADERKESSDVDRSSMRDRCNKGLRLLQVQDRVYKHVKHAAYNALDSTAEIQLVMQQYGKSFVEERPALHELLKQGFANLFSHQVLDSRHLIDILTLMDQSPNPLSEDNICGEEFLFALDALQSAEDIEDKDEVMKLIWKRCFIRDDWQINNNTVNKPDEVVQRQIQGSALYKTLRGSYEIGLWDAHTSIQCPHPSDVIGAGCSAQSLQARFGSDAALVGPIARDNLRDDEILQTYIKQCRLGFWYTACKEAATRSVQDEADLKAVMNKKETELVEVLRARDREGTGGLIVDKMLAKQEAKAAENAPDGFEGDDEEEGTTTETTVTTEESETQEVEGEQELDQESDGDDTERDDADDGEDTEEGSQYIDDGAEEEGEGDMSIDG